MAGVLQGQEQIRGQSVLRDAGIERVPVVNVENACASGSSALREALLAIRAGAYNTVLAVGFEKMYVGDRERSLAALESAADLEVVTGLGLQFTAIYAMRLRRRIDAGELEQRHLVGVTVKNHDNGALNPYAQHRKRCTEEEVLQSPRIADPLTLLMCSSISDGAAAVVLRRADLVTNGRPRQSARTPRTLKPVWAQNTSMSPKFMTRWPLANCFTTNNSASAHPEGQPTSSIAAPRP
jgi:acetyl-CoA acyltransferase